MNKVELGKTGVFVSEVSLGCMLMGSVINKENSFTALDRFIEMSGDFLDTANCPGMVVSSPAKQMIPIVGFSNLDQFNPNPKALGVSLDEEQMNILNQASV